MVVVGEKMVCKVDRSKIKNVRNYTESLQPPTLASFLTWGDSAGADRIALTSCKSNNRNVQCKLSFLLQNIFFDFLPLTVLQYVK